MKKVLITMAVLASMVAGTMVLSSFMASKTYDQTKKTEICVNEGWTKVGDYYGFDRNGEKSSGTFTIWERNNACNSYYWVFDNSSLDPDNYISRYPTNGIYTGVLRQNSEKRWYAALRGTNYFIDF